MSITPLSSPPSTVIPNNPTISPAATIAPPMSSSNPTIPPFSSSSTRSLSPSPISGSSSFTSTSFSSSSRLPSSSTFSTPLSTSTRPSSSPTTVPVASPDPITYPTTAPSRTSDFPITSTTSVVQISTTAPAQITAVGVNPTLSPDNNNNLEKSSFFKNTGAVAAVFVLVSLAVASILLWIFFCIRRRRRRRNERMEHDAAVAVIPAAARFRQTLDDNDDQRNEAMVSRTRPSDIEMNQHSTSPFVVGNMNSDPSTGRTWAHPAGHDSGSGAFNPFSDFNAQPGARERDVFTPPYSPPPVAFDGTFTRDGSGGVGNLHTSHSATSSAGSYEPLVAPYYRTTPPSSPAQGIAPPTPPPRSPLRLSKALGVSSTPPDTGQPESRASSVYSDEVN